MNQHRFAYISSLGGNEISCLVANKVLDIASDPEFLGNVKSIGGYLAGRLEHICLRHPDFLTKITSFGLAISIGVVSREIGRRLYMEMLAQGVLCHSVSEIDPPGLKLFPALIISESVADDISAALDRAASALRR